MQKIYRILRDNKEQGPFSIEELARLSLQPSDLIWQDGGIAAWKYPAEVEELQPYLTAAPADLATVPLQSASLIKSRSIVATEPEDPEIMTAEKLETKAQEIFDRVQSFTQQRSETGPEIKYAKSLDDLKQEYGQWLDKKTKRSTITLNRSTVAVLLIAPVLLLVVFFFLIGKKDAGQNLPVTSVKSAAPIVGPAEKKLFGKDQTTGIPSKKKRSSVDEFIDSVRQVLARQDAEMKNYHPQIRKRQSPPVMQEQNLAVKKPGPVLMHQPKSISGLVDMDARYIPSDNGRHLEILEVTIQNNSKAALKRVTVDVVYYRKGEQLKDKDTLYFDNISPGNSYTLSRPANKKATDAKFTLASVATVAE